MSRNTPADPQTQHELFRAAVDALGGTNAYSKKMGFTQRHAGGLYSGARTLHDGILKDTAAALIAHADLCRKLERRLSPAFAANLTEDQRAAEGKPDGRRYDRRQDGQSISFSNGVTLGFREGDDTPLRSLTGGWYQMGEEGEDGEHG